MEVVKKMIAEDPRDRPSAAEIIASTLPLDKDQVLVLIAMLS